VTDLSLIDPTALPFADAQTTAIITGFEVGERPSTVRVTRVLGSDALATMEHDSELPRQRLTHPRWSSLFRPLRSRRSGLVELGELCRVHRGQVTGSNRVWVSDGESELPAGFLFPAVTRAAELFAAGPTLDDDSHLRRVIDLPPDLAELDPEIREQVEAFLARARRQGADKGYIARHRTPWWSVKLREPAPILATYMARRPPAFVRNLVGARHINIAHGIYPRAPLPEHVIAALASYLTANVELADGRTYAGGLTKFEPGEMERLLVPTPERLSAHGVASELD
jgi:hypothetical protein